MTTELTGDDWTDITRSLIRFWNRRANSKFMIYRSLGQHIVSAYKIPKYVLERSTHAAFFLKILARNLIISSTGCINKEKMLMRSDDN